MSVSDRIDGYTLSYKPDATDRVGDENGSQFSMLDVIRPKCSKAGREKYGRTGRYLAWLRLVKWRADSRGRSRVRSCWSPYKLLHARPSRGLLIHSRISLVHT